MSTTDEFFDRMTPQYVRDTAAYVSPRLGEATDFDLDANESPYTPRISSMPPEGLNRYPPSQPEALRQRMAELYGVSLDSLIVTPGGDGGIRWAVHTFCEPGANAIVTHPPTFAMYQAFAQPRGVRVLEVPLLADQGYALNAQGILDMCAGDPGVKIVFLCSPNSPTGTSLSRKDIMKVINGLDKKALVLLDEAYIEYSREPSMATDVATHPNLIVLRALTKSYSLAGERVGSLIAHPRAIHEVLKVAEPYPIAITALRAATEVLQPENEAAARGDIAELVTARDGMTGELRALLGDNAVLQSDTNFLTVKVADPARLVAMFGEQGIKVRDRSRIITGAIRFSLGRTNVNEQVMAVFRSYSAAVAGGLHTAAPQQIDGVGL